MVLPAVLRDPARDPEQADGRHRAVLLDRRARIFAVARYFESAFGAFPSALQAVLLGAGRDLHRAWLSRLATGGKHLCYRGAPSHRLLLPAFPRDPAGARLFRDAEAAAEIDFGAGARQERHRGRNRRARAWKELRRAIMRKTALLIAAAALLGSASVSADAAEQVVHIDRQPWSFAGPFGTYDRAQLQRGYRVYKEVCAACHAMKLVAFRNLAQPGGPGFSEAQAKTVAAEFKI